MIVFAFLFAIVPIRVFVFRLMLKRRYYGSQIIANILIGAVCVVVLANVFGEGDDAPRALFVLFFIWASVETVLCVWSTSRWLESIRKSGS